MTALKIILPPKKETQTAKPKKIKPLIVKIANVEDEANGSASEVFEYLKPLGRIGAERHPREKCWDPAKLADFLIGKNWIAPRDKPKMIEVVNKAIRKRPREYWLCAAHVGWRPDRAGFVLHQKVVGAPRKKLILKPPSWLNDQQHTKLGMAGDLATWVKKVAKPSRFSTRLMLLISAAFAAPLVRVAGLQPFAILLYGNSKAGKTTALLAAASVIGLGRESQLPNFNTTDAAFLEQARLFNDLILPGNEVGLVKGAKKDIYSRIRGLLYAFAEGRDTTRHSGSSFASAGSSAAWRGIFLPNSEHSFTALAELAGEQRDPGEYARCVDIPATRNRLPTVFDRPPKSVTQEKLSGWAKGQLTAIRTACEANHGVAITPFLEYLMDQGADLPGLVQGYMQEFETALAFTSEDGALQHAARNFALVYAGGRLAIDAQILPWKPELLRSALTHCFNAAIRALGRHKPVATRARKILLSKLRSLQVPTKGSRGVNPNQQPGFRQVVQGRTVYTISAPAMKDWFPDIAHFRAALDWLDDQRLLEKGTGSPKPRGKGIDWAVTSPRWTKERKARSIQFRDPIVISNQG